MSFTFYLYLCCRYIYIYILRKRCETFLISWWEGGGVPHPAEYTFYSAQLMLCVSSAKIACILLAFYSPVISVVRSFIIFFNLWHVTLSKVHWYSAVLRCYRNSSLYSDIQPFRFRWFVCVWINRQPPAFTAVILIRKRKGIRTNGYELDCMFRSKLATVKSVRHIVIVPDTVNITHWKHHIHLIRSLWTNTSISFYTFVHIV